MTRYELLERIGAGGMAEIFRAKAVAAGGFEKPVAIKRILPHLSQDSRFVELLIAEAKILSQLRHRNIVQIFDVGLGDDGQYFLVMEFVDGMDLGNVQRGLEGRRKRLPLDLVLHIGAEICEALQHAHAAPAPDGSPMRLVHRDVSPSNVLISRSGEVKLTDFGIAKRPEEHTGQHGVRGKFAYISPEQAENRHVDARSDVFSVGVLLFELALGHRLFSQLPDFDALTAVRTSKIPAPREIDPALPADVEKILLGALARDPAQRTATAGELGASLRTVRYSLETTAGDPSTELARIVASMEVSGRDLPDAKKAPKPAGKRRRAPSSGFEPGEPTVVRIKTAAEFSSTPGDTTAIMRAKLLLDRFEEEETRLGGRSGRGPFPSEEVTLSGKPSLALEMGDSGALAEEETRVMSQAQARRVLAQDDESTQTVTQRRPGAEVAAAIAAATGQQGPSPTLGAATQAPPPAALLRASMAGGASSRGATSSPKSARTPLPEQAAAARGGSVALPVPAPRTEGSVRIEAQSDRSAPPTERDSFNRAPPPRRPAAAAAARPATAGPSWLSPRLRRLLGSRTRRRWLLGVAAVGVATASFLAASAVLGGGANGEATTPDAAPIAPAAAVPQAPDAAPLDAGAAAGKDGGANGASPARTGDAPREKTTTKKPTAKPSTGKTGAKTGGKTTKTGKKKRNR